MKTEAKYTDPNTVPEEMRKKIIGLIHVLFPQAKIYLYGSRARGTHHDRSDIDLAIDAGKKDERLKLGEARSILEAMHTPYKIDLVDLNSVNESLRTTILKEGIVWNN